MSFPIQILTCDHPLSLSRREILRYMRCGEGNDRMCQLADEAAQMILPLLQCRACFGYFPLQDDSRQLHLGFADTQSTSLRRHLGGCDRVLVFAATVGAEVDRLLTRLSALSPSRAVAVDAAATAAIEAWCDELCARWEEQVRADGYTCRPRFSAGYGDCPLELQIPLVAALDTPRKIGVSLTDSLLMTPTKSVTALVGLAPCADPLSKEPDHESHP